jgi:tripartite motif-containing protein 71
MTLAPGDKVISVQTRDVPVAVGYIAPALGDRVIVVNGIAMKYTAPAVGDHVVLVPVKGGTRIAVPTMGNAPIVSTQYMEGIAINSTSTWLIYAGTMPDGEQYVRKATLDGTLIKQWGSYGTGDGQFIHVGGVAIDSTDHIYVTDVSPTNKLTKFDSEGNFVWRVSIGQDPYGVACQSNTYVLVVCRDTARVEKYNYAGVYQYYFGVPWLGYPFGISVQGNYAWVVDRNNSRVVKYAISSGAVIATYGNLNLSYPYGICINSSGEVYISDRGNSLIRKFDSGMVHLLDWGSEGTGDGQFDRATFLAVDSSGNVYVSDTYNGRIQKFTSDGTFITKWS